MVAASANNGSLQDLSDDDLEYLIAAAIGESIRRIWLKRDEHKPSAAELAEQILDEIETVRELKSLSAGVHETLPER